MVEVRKYFCCTDNPTAYKIIGGVQIALYAIFLIKILDTLVIPIIAAVWLGSLILCAISLVVAASKRSATMLMVWIVLNGIGIGLMVTLLNGNEHINQSLIRMLIAIEVDYQSVIIFAAVKLGLWILCAILLVFVASNRNAAILMDHVMVWIILNGMGIRLGVIGLEYSLIGSLIWIGLGILAELIKIGAREEGKSEVKIE